MLVLRYFDFDLSLNLNLRLEFPKLIRKTGPWSILFEIFNNAEI